MPWNPNLQIWIIRFKYHSKSKGLDSKAKSKGLDSKAKSKGFFSFPRRREETRKMLRLVSQTPNNDSTSHLGTLLVFSG